MKLVVAGGGVLGSQIAFQAAYSGHDVTIWLRSEGSIARTQPKLDSVRKSYEKAIKEMAKGTGVWCNGIAPNAKKFDEKKALEQLKNTVVKLELDLEKAVKGADLIIESVSEQKQDKINFYKKLAGVVGDKTIVATNSSTMLPSTFAKYTQHETKYLAMHFANSIWKNNITEVMAQPQTSAQTFKKAQEFAESMNMIPLPVKKEKSGYLLNSMLVPFLLSALDLYANGVSDPASIDKAWKSGTGAPNGPFEIMDVVGIKTTYDIIEQYQKVPSLINPLLKKMMLPYNYKKMAEILKKMLDSGKTGVAAGEGFFKYK